MSDPDLVFLEQAVALSRRHMELGHGGPFGAVIVKDGAAIAEGWNEVTSSNDPTAHAEVVAIRRACRQLGTFSLVGATIYASCEPCPMCLAAIYWARIGRLVFAQTREQAAAIGFDDALIYEEIGKPLDARQLSIRHLPSASAEAAFQAWMAKIDRVRY